MKTAAKICHELTVLILGIDDGDVPLSDAIIKMIEIIDKRDAAVRQQSAKIIKSMPRSAPLGTTNDIDRADTVRAVLAGRVPDPAPVQRQTHTDPAPAPDLDNNIDRLGGPE